jgi:hypothetical protein
MNKLTVHEPIRVDEADWTKKIKQNHKKKGFLYMKQRKYVPYRKYFFYLTERWLCYAKSPTSANFTRINLEYECTEIMAVVGYTFEIKTCCGQNYWFKADSSNDAEEWKMDLDTSKA